MSTFAKNRKLANTANRAVKGKRPKYRGRDHVNLHLQITTFIKWDEVDMNRGVRWDHFSPRIARLVGGVILHTWVQDHLKGVPQPLLVVGLMQA